MTTPVGTIFVELDLDPSRYTRGQQRLYRDATSTSLKIEENFRKLGIKSSAEFDLMRQKIANAYEMIKSSAQATANDILRAERARAEQIQKINEQQFGHHKSLLDGLKSHYLAVTAGIAGALGGIHMVWRMTKIGAEYEEQRGILDNLSRKYKSTASDIVSAMREAADGQISAADLMQVALGGISKGLQPEQLINLAEAAETLADATGGSATQALQDLAQALETGRTRSLKQYLGTTLDLKSAFGALEGKMAVAEKAQAMYTITMIKALEIQREQTKAVDDTGNRLARIEAQYQNLVLAAGRTLKGAIVGVADYLAPTSLFRQSLEEVTKTKDAIDERIRAYQKENEALKAIISTREDNAKRIKESAEEMLKIAEKAYLKEMEFFQEREDEAKKYFEDQQKLLKKIQDDAKTPLDTYREKLSALHDVYDRGAISLKQYNVAANKYTEDLEKSTKDDFKELKQAIEGWGKDSAKAIVDFTLTGKQSFGDMIDSMISDVLRMMVYQNMTGPLFKSIGGIDFGDALGGLFNVNPFGISAKGNAFSHGNVIPFAKGGVVKGPTIFPMARGTGLMGEKGPEAVMPLARLPGGDLGVKAAARGIEVKINIINNTSADVQIQNMQETQRGVELDVLIDEVVAKKMSQFGSASNKMMRQDFGARERLIRR